MINNTSKIDIKNGLHIKYHPPVSIEKPFSKTHPPVFGIGVLEKFIIYFSLRSNLGVLS